MRSPYNSWTEASTTTSRRPGGPPAPASAGLAGESTWGVKLTSYRTGSAVLTVHAVTGSPRVNRPWPDSCAVRGFVTRLEDKAGSFDSYCLPSPQS